ncbi:MAG: hypothetical protein WC898_02615 [Candidatus Paceibacterota bacterium]|jgi:hypothetical protein
MRWGVNPYVAFLISGYDLSTLQTPVDFDAESDAILEKIKQSAEQRPRYAFEYRVGVGFEEVDPETQTWFDFK